MAYAQEGGATETFRFAWISDTHLLPKEVNTRFVEKAVRAVNDVKAMDPPPDFLIFGGDLAQLGDPVELKLGNEIIKELQIKKVFIPGARLVSRHGQDVDGAVRGLALDLRPQGCASSGSTP